MGNDILRRVTTRLGCAVFAALALGAGCSRRPDAPAAPVKENAGGWEEVRIGTDAVFSGLHFVDSKVGWIVG